MCDEQIMPIYSRKLGELFFDFVDGEGRIIFGTEFAFSDEVTQKDLLCDWIALMQNMYNDLCEIAEEESDAV